MDRFPGDFPSRDEIERLAKSHAKKDVVTFVTCVVLIEAEWQRNYWMMNIPAGRCRYCWRRAVRLESGTMCSRDGRCVQELSESKRKSRNLSEKKRRDSFNSLVTELAFLVTGVERRQDKSNVLKQTIAFLKKHNLLQDECANSEGVDQSVPPFLSSVEYLHLLLDSLESFLFVVDIGSDADTAVISYVSENAARFGSSFVEQLRGKSLYDILDPDYEAFVRDTFRSKVLTSNTVERTELSEVGSSTRFFGFNCVMRMAGNDSVCGNDGLEIEFCVKARFKSPNGASGLGCLCLARPTRQGLLDSHVVPRLDVLGSATDCEFSSRVTVEWKFINVDPSVTHVLGYHPIEMLGMSWYDFCHLDDLDVLVRSHEEMKKNTDGITAPYRFRTKSDEYIWTRTRFYVTYHEWNSKLEFITCAHNTLADAQLQEEFGGKPAQLRAAPAQSVSSRSERYSSIDQLPSSANHSQLSQHPNRQIFRPQPGVRIEHTPIPNANLAPKPPPSKKSKNDIPGAANFPEDIATQSIGQLNERMLWELLEKRQTNLQEKILQHQQELKRLQEQLLQAMPLLSSPCSSSGTNEMDMISPTSTLSSASGSMGPSNGSRGNNWMQQQPPQNYTNNGENSEMNFDSSNVDNKNVDPELLRFIESEAQRQQFQNLVHVLTDSCWDICLPDKLGAKLDGKTETCLTNCVNRFIDASNFIVGRLDDIRQKNMNKFQ